MIQHPINERIKFLIEQSGMSVRAFSTAMGVTDTNTRNYIDRGAKPNSDFLEKLLRRFHNTNPTWLLLGEGEPLLDGKTDVGVSEPLSKKKASPSSKNNSGNNIDTNHGEAIQHQGGQFGKDWEQWAATIAKESEAKIYQALLRENETLRSQIQDKERMIQLLLKQLPS